MSGARVLLKLAGPVTTGQNIRVSLTPSNLPTSADGQVRLRHLFDAPPAASPGRGLATSFAPPSAWYVTEADGVGLGAGSAHPWDLAHSAVTGGLALNASRVIAAEPDLQQGWSWAPPDTAEPHGPALAATDPCTPSGQKAGAYDLGPAFGWHLDDAFSGLRAARETVGDAAGGITIVHLDTGYDPGHVALPPGLDRARQRNLVDTDRPNDASDNTPQGGFLRNRGHGTGTIGLLAGGDAAELSSDTRIPHDFGPLGGIPGARIVPVRIANGVVQFTTSTVAQGIDYAREIGADVLSMSMGGLPSSAWADAVNKAYEAGVVLVCAAGNSFSGLPTSLIVYPARFNRVIAACGVMAGNHPYHSLGGQMEGNVGPASKMATAIAAFTPNVPWLRLGCPNVVDMDGNGTSAATPQVAAAAALWLAKNGAGYPRGWQRVEAVRRGLFDSANRLGHGDAQADPNFGRGLLSAHAALFTLPNLNDLTPTAADSASFAFLHLLSSVFGIDAQASDPRRASMYAMELTQLALNSPAAREAVPDPGLPPERIPDSARRKMLEAILDERTCSLALRSYLETALGRAGVGGRVMVPSVIGISRARTGADVARRVVHLPPPCRRLRVFATDPGDSSRLGTAFINTATIEVPWEEKLEPGPVGEYVEVIDVDPASNAAYEPVDLQDPHLLAQDGLAPSEGQPQFHQQMVYGVAMRTIRNFEIALGRRALWAERLPQWQNGRFQPAPNAGYVQKLRIYPHGLREQNAYYSPDRKALLFGYFDVDGPGGGGGGGRTVFNCLSHDVVAHETTHALLDGLHRRYQDQTNPDVLAFHEAFADIVAIFQHFTFPELLRNQIGQLHGDLKAESILSDLARQFGQSLHNGRALRRALDPEFGRLPDPADGTKPPAGAKRLTYAATMEPHMRGAILVAAVYDAFVSVYTRRSADLFRLATGGSGVLQPGAIHPDLVERLAQTAVEVAQRILTTAIRALDYMPPIDPRFGDYLRALVTADADLAQDHGAGYRVAFAEAFAARGIYPENIRSVGPESLCWQTLAGPVQSARLNDFIRTLNMEAFGQSDRRSAFNSAKTNAALLHDWMAANLDEAMAFDLGLDFGLDDNGQRHKFEVHSVRPARRMTADSEQRVDVVAVITQRLMLPLDPAAPDGETFPFRGGCTLILDREYRTDPIRFAVTRPIWNKARQQREREYRCGANGGLNALYGSGGMLEDNREPFAMFHRCLSRDDGQQGGV